MLHCIASIAALSYTGPALSVTGRSPAAALRSSRPAVYMGFLDELKEMAAEQTAEDPNSPFAQRQARLAEEEAALKADLVQPKFSTLEEEKDFIMSELETNGLEWATETGAFKRMSEIDEEIKARDAA